MKNFLVKALSALLVLCLTLALAPVALMEETIEVQEDVVENAAVEVAEEQASEPTEEEAEPSEETVEADVVIEAEAVDEVMEEALAADLVVEEALDLDLAPSVIPMFDAEPLPDEYAPLIEISKAFPDEKFREVIAENDLPVYYDGVSYEKDGWLSESEISYITGISFYRYNSESQDYEAIGVKSLEGIQYLTALNSLYLNYCTLESVDVSMLKNLEHLTCDNAQIGSLNASNTALSSLYINSSQIGSLNVSGCSSMDELYLSNCKVETLNAAGCESLTDIYCYNNQLSELNVAGCTNLETLRCGKNALNNLSVKDCAQLRVLDCQRNNLTAIDVSNCSMLARAVQTTYSFPYYDYEDDDFKAVEYGFEGDDYARLIVDEGVTLTPEPLADEPVVQIDEAHFPDASFRNLVSQWHDTNGDGFISKGEIARTVTIDIEGEWVDSGESGYYKGIGAASIKGIEYFTEIETLYARNNRLTSVDLSKNTKLEYVFISGNQLTTLDISKCPELVGYVNSGNYELSEDHKTVKYRIKYQEDSDTWYDTRLQCDSNVRIIGGNPVAPYVEPTPTVAPAPAAPAAPATPTIAAVKKTSKTTITAAPGSVYQLDLAGATGKSFKSSKKKVATVSKTGLVTVKKAGKTKITFKVGKKKRTVTLTVKDPTIPTSVALNMAGTVAAKKGESVTLTATLPEGTYSGIKWKSSNKKVATVSKTGVVKFKKAGKVTITATASRGKKKAKVKFKVSK